MQSPEVWTFKEPSSYFHIQEYKTFPENILKEFYFNHLVSVVIPECLKIPQNLLKVLTDDCEYYKLIDINLSHLLNPTFLDNFIRRGNLTALSIGTRIDCDNCIAVTPTGVLILVLNKDTYQTFGLEGSVSFFTQRNKDRYIVKIDLKDATVRPGNKKYDRIKDALHSLEKFTLIMSWEPPEESICPSSIAKFFVDLQCDVKVCRPKFKTHVLYSINTPMVFQQNVEEHNVIDFVEWLGMVANDGDFLGSFDSYVNTYEPPEPYLEIGQIRFIQWRGLYLPRQIETLTKLLREYSNTENKLWIAAYVQGFSDMPIVKLNHEHHYFTNGDNGTVLVFGNNRFISCCQRSSLKKYK